MKKPVNPSKVIIIPQTPQNNSSQAAPAQTAPEQETSKADAQTCPKAVGQTSESAPAEEEEEE